MYCKNCGNKLSDDTNFCPKCGMVVENNNIGMVETNVNNAINENMNNMSMNNNVVNKNQMENSNQTFNTNQTVNAPQMNSIPQSKRKNKGVVITVLIVAVVATVMILISQKPKDDEYSDNNNYSTSEDNNNNNNANNNTNNNNSGTNNKVKGNYSREVFSNNSFNYITNYDTAVFKFNNDSTFKVDYKNGSTYTGTYEVYNGFYISVKANEIKEDVTITNGKVMAEEIKRVTNEMMTTTEDMLNTYLLWIKTNDGILQPFAVKYDPKTNTGTAINILGITKGSFNLKQ